MKRLLALLAMLTLIVIGFAAPVAHAEQSNSIYTIELSDAQKWVPLNTPIPRGTVRSHWSLWKVENEGDASCDHSYAVQSLRGYRTTSCAVIHGPAGCPDDWGFEGRICRKCLRKEEWQERREFVPEPTEYERLDSQLRKARP